MVGIHISTQDSVLVQQAILLIIQRFADFFAFSGRCRCAEDVTFPVALELDQVSSGLGILEQDLSVDVI